MASESTIECRLLRDVAAPGAWNMAVDDMLLEQGSRMLLEQGSRMLLEQGSRMLLEQGSRMLLEQGSANATFCLRFYRWSEPTLSLGYFQPYADRQTHRASRDCALVRRTSGGGAILHDQELTYSLVAPARHLMSKETEWLYITVHEALIETLARFGVTASINRSNPRLRPEDEPFLCFERRAVGDVVLEGFKIAGSAQRRRHGAVLQHGSVLLGTSPFAPELPGISALTGKTIASEELSTAWLTALARSLGVAWRPERLSEHEIDTARRLEDEKFAHADWNQRR
jgi:lipoate-protein ligase A